MVDFTNVTALKITKENLAEYPLIELGKDISLTMRCASESNPGYMNGLLRLTGQVGQTRRNKEEVEISAEKMDEVREHDRELYPEHVITGWKGVIDAKGNPVKFSIKVCKEFMKALPDYVFDGVRGYGSVPKNFAQVIDAVEKAKNLAKG